MNRFWKKLKFTFQDPVLRKRILIVLLGLLAYRVLATIPIPGIDTFQLEQFFANNELLGLFNLFAGGGLSNLSIVMLGVGPYITASIILQLLTIMVPRLKELYHEEGQAGRRKFTQYSRVLTVPLAAIQGFGFLLIFQQQGLIAALSPEQIILNVIIVTAGAVFLMWIGELMSEFGIGNGVSILIFAGIVAQLPQILSQLAFTFDPAQIPMYIGFVVAALVITFGVVFVNEAERPIPITHARAARGFRSGTSSTHLPLRINQAGVMPVIFALSILMLPQMLFSILSFTGVGGVTGFSTTVLAFLNNTLIYGILYFVLTFLFTFFYSAITFDVGSVSENLGKTGAFIPGVRPGQSTEDYLSRILSRITFIGGLFLAVIAVLPIIMQAITGVQALAIGGTALLIVVAVIIDLVKRVDAQLTMKEY